MCIRDRDTAFGIDENFVPLIVPSDSMGAIDFVDTTVIEIGDDSDSRAVGFNIYGANTIGVSIADYQVDVFDPEGGVLMSTQVKLDFFGFIGLVVDGDFTISRVTVTNRFPETLGGEIVDDIQVWGGSSVLLGDVNLDGNVNLLDVDPFVEVVTSGKFQAEADTNEDGMVNLLDVDPFIALVGGG